MSAVQNRFPAANTPSGPQGYTFVTNMGATR